MISPLDRDFSQLNTFLETQKPTQLFILADEHTHGFCLPTLLGNLETELPFEIIEIEAGEEMKNIDTATHLWEILAGFSADRKSLLIALGGGVITDLGGFVASTYKRGIPFIHLPTTLLGMCDASIGGKTGIDHLFLKNIIGTFSLPEQIFLYPDFLKTLPHRELRSGFAEMLKHGLIADEAHWNDLTALENINPDHLSPLIERSMQIKQNVVEQDYREKNVRKILNFGHTIGHAIESYFMRLGAPIPHGEAVAAGMICETHLSGLAGYLAGDVADEVIANLRKFYPKLTIEGLETADLLADLTNDKKNTDGKTSFSLITGIGACKIDCFVEDQLIIRSLEFYKNMV